MTSYIKPVSLACDVYKPKTSLAKAYEPLKPTFIGPKGSSIPNGIVIKDGRTLYVALRGCKDLDEVLYCVDTRVRKPFLSRNIVINSAIWNKYEEMRDEIQDVVKSADVDDIIYTGHSLGGAIAQLCKAFNDKDSQCVSFGAPYVGNSEFKNEVDQRGINTRVVVQQDIIPKIKFNSELVHAGEELSLKSMSDTLFPFSIYDHHTSINYLKCLKSKRIS